MLAPSEGPMVMDRAVGWGSMPGCGCLRSLPVRSFTLPPGFMNSALPKMRQPVRSLSDWIRTRGVLPTMSQTLPAGGGRTRVGA